MNELINNPEKRKALLKHMILQLHEGEAPDQVKRRLKKLLAKVPYNEVVEVEQELITEGLPQEEVLKLCDVHGEVLKGHIDRSAEKEVSSGHPVDTFRQENKALDLERISISKIFSEIEAQPESDDVSNQFRELQGHFNLISDVEKHYLRKENLLFPFLEKHGITGPSGVMWGKHDETRVLLKAAHDAFADFNKITAGEAKPVISLLFEPLIKSIEEMIYKEEEILLPMSLDTLTEGEWYKVAKQSAEIGYCLYSPEIDWAPEAAAEDAEPNDSGNRIVLPSGSLLPEELIAILNHTQVDMTFVDKDDTVRFFTEGAERIFPRNRAIIGRKVQNCHPPKSVAIVEKILADFKSGRADHAPFWINRGDQFIHIEYLALRNQKGEYLGTLEVSQDLSAKRKLQGEQRLVNYSQVKK